jgi:hypothetical protein
MGEGGCACLQSEYVIKGAPTIRQPSTELLLGKHTAAFVQNAQEHVYHQ